MLHSMKRIEGLAIHARDGEIGVLKDFYFDARNWVVRYMVVDAGDWLDGRRLLFATHTFQEGAFDAQRVALPVSRDRVASSPSIGVERPLSMEDEIALHDYYQWPIYWDTRTDDALGPGTPAAYPMIELMTELEEKTSLPKDVQSHLRSANEVFGYRLEARDGDIGSADDFIFEDDGWRIVYMVVDTGGWLPGKKVLVSPSWIEEVDWEDSEIEIDLKRETVKDSPEYDPDQPLNREYEQRLYDHYGRRGYW